MKKRVILSTNNSPDYFFYAPIVEWAWNKFGWHVDLFITHDVHDFTLKNGDSDIHSIPPIDKVRPGTCAQTVRHFASNVLPKEDYIMVQDIDLIPLKPWDPDINARTIYGWELTGHSFIPVHYTGMTGDKWYELMGCTGDLAADMEREMKANGRAYGEKWEEYWDTDWDILTAKVIAQKSKFNFIHRGMVSLAHTTPDGKGNAAQTAAGRIDRYNYKLTMEQDWIDMHCENHNPSAPEKWAVIKEVMTKVFGSLPEWMEQYVIDHHIKYGR